MIVNDVVTLQGKISKIEAPDVYIELDDSETIKVSESVVSSITSGSDEDRSILFDDIQLGDVVRGSVTSYRGDGYSTTTQWTGTVTSVLPNELTVNDIFTFRPWDVLFELLERPDRPTAVGDVVSEEVALSLSNGSLVNYSSQSFVVTPQGFRHTISGVLDSPREDDGSAIVVKYIEENS